MKNSIAVFKESYSTVLILLRNFESLKYASIPYLICYGTVRWPSEAYGKKHALRVRIDQTQDMVAGITSLQARLFKGFHNLGLSRLNCKGLSHPT
jgi:hypothetical protein